MTLRTFTERAVRLNGQPFRLNDRPYLDELYQCAASKIVVRVSRQVEKSTFVVNTILHHAINQHRAQILFVAPRLEQSRMFSKVRLAGTVMDSTILRRILWPYERALPPIDIQFANKSNLFIRSAFHSADSIRGITADMLLIDEFQDLAPGELPVLEETLSHVEGGRLVLTGTPKLIDNHLEMYYSMSTACEWQVPCTGCGQLHLMDDRVLGPASLICPACQLPLDALGGRWIARNPQSTWGAGYWINHLMVPWMSVPQILNRQSAYDVVRFRNEVLGLPTNLGDHIITREEIEACCDDRAPARNAADVPPNARRRLVAGLDWGGGGFSHTVLAIGYIERNRVFRVVRLERWPPNTDAEQMLTEISRICAQLRVWVVAADGAGLGRMNNRLLLARLLEAGLNTQMYSIFYSAADQQPVQEGRLWRWTVSRSGSIGTLFGRIKKGLLRFPRVADCSSYLDEFVCEVVEYDSEMRSVKYTKPDTMRDDSLHAVNYCELVGLRIPESQIS